jgi:hypothetical protein
MIGRVFMGMAVMFLCITIGAGTGKAAEKASDGRFIANGDGTVTDTKTSLMWAAKDSDYDINWGDAKSYCESYRGGGYTDWRMPKWDELAGLYNSNKSYQLPQRGYSVHLTELIQLSDCCPWASETRGTEGAIFDFGNGPRIWSPKSYVGPALPVRSGK